MLASRCGHFSDLTFGTLQQTVYDLWTAASPSLASSFLPPIFIKLVVERYPAVWLAMTRK